MSLFGSFYTGVSGMTAQSRATAVVSNNIANLTTTGFKRSDTSFHNIVTSSIASPAGAGAVMAKTLLRAGTQGSIRQTDSTLDAGVSGNGFFTVRRAPDDTQNLYYTRNGQFGEQPYDSGDPDNPFIYLRNSAGFYLYGWQLDENGALPANTGVGDLVPVDVSIYDNAFLATSRVAMALNINASEPVIDPHTMNPPQQLPVSNQASQFTRSFQIVDGAGNSRNVTMEFRHITGPMAHFTTGVAGAMGTNDAFIPLAGNGLTPGINNGDQFSIQVSGGATETYTFVNEFTGDDTAINQAATVHGLISAINAHGGGDELRASLENGRLIVRAANPTATITLNDVTGTPLTSANGLAVPDVPAGGGLVFAPEASLTANGAANPDQTLFPAFANTTDPNVHNWWEMRLLIADPADPNAANPTLVEISKGLINFNGDGTLNALPDANGDTAIDLTAPIDFDTAAAGEESGFIFDISGFMQASGSYTVIDSDQNGILAGQRTGVAINTDGQVSALFSNGLSRPLYQIPLATFRNPDGLGEINGAAFEETPESGVATLSQPGEDAAGIVLPSTLESSNVDLGTEFGKLIVSQRAYGAASQIIRTVDEMTQRAAQLNR